MINLYQVQLSIKFIFSEDSDVNQKEINDKYNNNNNMSLIIRFRIMSQPIEVLKTSKY